MNNLIYIYIYIVCNFLYKDIENRIKIDLLCNQREKEIYFHRALALFFLHIFVFSLVFLLAKQAIRKFPKRMSG